MTTPKQLPRWIKSSVAKHFVALRQDIDTYVEGQERDTDTLREWFEVRVDGPNIDQKTKHDFEVLTEVNILIVCTQNAKDNAYRVDDLTGIVTAAFTNIIHVYKYGPSTDPANDGSHYGCLHLQPGAKEKVVTSFFGKVRPEADIVQASVEGHYHMFLYV